MTVWTAVAFALLLHLFLIMNDVLVSEQCRHAAWHIDCDLWFILIKADCTAHSVAHTANQRWIQQTLCQIVFTQFFHLKDLSRKSYCTHIYILDEYVLLEDWKLNFPLKQRCFILFKGVSWFSSSWLSRLQKCLTMFIYVYYSLRGYITFLKYIFFITL